MAKFKVGDKVKICKCEPTDVFPNWVDDMDRYIGDITTVERITKNGNYQLENTFYKWHENWLEPAEFGWDADELKEFDILELRNGQMRMVLKIGNKLSVGTLWLDNWEDELYWSADKNPDPYDVMKVYRPIDSIPTDKSKWKDFPVVWGREHEVKEMTVEEISEALGYEVKIVKGEK